MNCKKGILFSALTLILTAVTVCILMRGVSMHTFLEALSGAKLRWLLGGFLLMLLYVGLEGVCIKIVMESLEEPAPIFNCIKYAFIGFYFSGVTPSASGGQPVQIYCMGRDRFSLSKSVLCLLVISSVYQISMLFYGLGFYAFFRTLFDQTVKKIGWLLLLGGGLNVLFVCVVLFMMFQPKSVEYAVMWVLHRLGKMKCAERRAARWEDRAHRLLSDYAAGAAHIRENKKMVAALFGITFIRLTILYLMPWFVSLAFGLKGNSAFHMIGLQAILTLSVSSLPFPGSVGVSEAVSLLVFGMMFSSALLLPAVLLLRGINFYGVLVAAGLVTVAAAGESFAKSFGKR